MTFLLYIFLLNSSNISLSLIFFIRLALYRIRRSHYRGLIIVNKGIITAKQGALNMTDIILRLLSLCHHKTMYIAISGVISNKIALVTLTLTLATVEVKCSLESLFQLTMTSLKKK